MADGYRPRVYGSKRTGREWLNAEERKTGALRRDADESVVEAPAPLNEPGIAAVDSLGDEDPVVKRLPSELHRTFVVTIDRRNVEPLHSVVQRYIAAVYEECGGNKAKTAEALQIGRTTIYRRFGLRKN